MPVSCRFNDYIGQVNSSAATYEDCEKALSLLSKQIMATDIWVSFPYLQNDRNRELWQGMILLFEKKAHAFPSGKSLQICKKKACESLFQ